MSPREFLRARQGLSPSSAPPTTSTTAPGGGHQGGDPERALSSPVAAFVVCGRPYLPQLFVRPDSDRSSVQWAVAAVLMQLVRQQHARQPVQRRPSNGHIGDGTKEDEKECWIPLSKDWTVEPVGGGVTNRLFRVGNIDCASLRRGAAAVVVDPLDDRGEAEGRATADISDENHTNHASSSLSSLPLFASTSTTTTLSCLVRVFGAEGMIDRDVETTHFAQLASQGLAPAYYGRVGNARIEGWCDNMRPLDVQELNHPDKRTGIATEMAKLHALFRVEDNNDDNDNDDDAEKNAVVLWTQLHEWCTSAVEFHRQKPWTTTVSKGESDPSLPIEAMPGELHWIRRWIDNGRGNHQLEVAFCHNDVLAANVLWDDDAHKIQLIDFEYGGTNYVAFDIANHWNEYAGGPPHTSHPNYEWFPTPDDQAEFVRAYLVARKRIEQQQQQQQQETMNKTASSDDLSSSNDLVVDDDEVSELLKDVQAFVLVNHLYWGLWAVNQAYTEGCDDYDYATYAHKRFEQYVKVKEETFLGVQT